MGGDYTRMRFDARNDGAEILSQQGRVMLDADLNELVEIIDRRFRSETIDIIGPCTVPKETPDGFKIYFAGGQLMIGRGRIYVDGLQAENHGDVPLEYDTVLGGEAGTVDLPYTAQPYYPNPDPLPAKGKHLVYVHVFKREQTALMDADLVDKAVNVDTGVRIQTAWQVEVLGDSQPDLTCSTPDNQVQGWTQVTQPSGGRLTAVALGVAKSDDPCYIPPSGGYRGTENRLYRIEIHDPGALGAATFKWSRDNGSVSARVLSINTTGDVLTVDRTARDSVLRFSTDDWVEVTDDWLELHGKPGVMAKVLSVDDVLEQITLKSGAAILGAAFDATKPERHTRIRRWDQKGAVLDAGNNVVGQVDPMGLITVPAGGTTLQVESGIQITFSTGGVGQFLTGDYWEFAARTSDASIEPLADAPPRGILHHYCRLAVADFDNQTADSCRVLWPPDFGGGCDCTECVSAESHNTGQFTIQAAIDQIKGTGGTVCLGPGVYELTTNQDNAAPIQIVGATSLTIKGQGTKTQLHYPAKGPAVQIAESDRIALLDMQIAASGFVVDPKNPIPSAGIAIKSSTQVRIERCSIVHTTLLSLSALQLIELLISTEAAQRRGLGAAITLQGTLAEITIRENQFLTGWGIVHSILGRYGIAEIAPSKDVAGHAAFVTHDDAMTTVGGGAATFALIGDLRVDDNVFLCLSAAVALIGACIFYGQNRIAGNFAAGCVLMGVGVMGTIIAPASLDISRNQVFATLGVGIGAALERARIQDNDVQLMLKSESAGIAVRDSPLGRIFETDQEVSVVGNRVAATGGAGIAFGGSQPAVVDANVVSRAGVGGIVWSPNSTEKSVHVTDNQVRNVGAGTSAGQLEAIVGISVTGAAEAMVANNAVLGVGLGGPATSTYHGILVAACGSTHISHNHVADVGPDQFTAQCAGIAVPPGFDRCAVIDNTVRRRTLPPAQDDHSVWRALLIGQAQGVTYVALGSPPMAGYYVLGANAYRISRWDLLVVPRGKELTSVRGNVFQAHGLLEQVNINVAGLSSFGENTCIQSPVTAPSKIGPRRVLITCGALICTSNYVESALGDLTISATVPAAAPYTIVGNITTNAIELNGGSLPALPWGSLNVVGS